MDNFVDPIDSMTIERHVKFSTRFDARDILRRFSKQWSEYKGDFLNLVVEDKAAIYAEDVTDFLERLVEDYGCETVFGNEWQEDETEVEIYG